MNSVETNGVTKTQALDWVFRALLGLVILLTSIIGWQGRQVLVKIDSHETRITHIEASRYTREMGNALKDEVASLKESMARYGQSEIETQRRLTAIDQKLDKIIERLP